MMKYLLDTHVLIWALTGDKKLPTQIRQLIEDEQNIIYYSSVSVFEVEIKKMVHPDEELPSGETLIRDARKSGYRLLPLDNSHILAIKSLDRGKCENHKDPFDWLLVSQSKVEDMGFLTVDSKILQYNEPCVKHM